METREYGVLVELVTHVRVYVEAGGEPQARGMVDARIAAGDLGEGTSGLAEGFEGIPLGAWDMARTVGGETECEE